MNTVSLPKLSLPTFTKFRVSFSDREFKGILSPLSLTERNEAQIVKALVDAAEIAGEWTQIPYRFGAKNYVKPSPYYKVEGDYVYPTSQTQDYPWKQ
jgi:hypothetical protein